MTREQRAAHRLLTRAGWVEQPRRGKGSHRVYQHPDGRTAVVGLRNDIRHTQRLVGDFTGRTV